MAFSKVLQEYNNRWLDHKARRWLKDRFGVSWQVVPRVLPELLMDPDPAKSARAMQALLERKKLDIAALQQAFNGNPT